QKIQTELEMYFASNNVYRTLGALNLDTERQFFDIDLSREDLRDPKGSAGQLVSKPTNNAYSYEVTTLSGSLACKDDPAAGAMACRKYTLTATLEAGGTYTKSNLN